MNRWVGVRDIEQARENAKRSRMKKSCFTPCFSHSPFECCFHSFMLCTADKHRKPEMFDTKTIDIAYVGNTYCIGVFVQCFWN